MINPHTVHPILWHLGRYMFALGVVGAGLLLCFSIPEVMAPRPFLAFWPVVVVAAEFGGKGPGVLATVASVLCVGLIFNPSHGGLNLHDWVGMTALGIFLVGGLAISVFIGEKLKIQSLQRLQAAAVAVSEARYRSLFEAANVGKSMTLLTGEIQVNQAFCDMLGYAPEEMRGKTWQALTPPEEIGPINEQLATLLRGEKDAVRFEKRYIHKNGSYVWTDVSAVIQRDGEGKPMHFIMTVVDITERKRGEAEREKFVMLADSSSEFIGMCDLDMNPVYVNAAGLLMVGLPDLAAACQVKVQDYFFPEDQQFIAEEFFPRVLREGHGDVEIRLRHFQTGEPVWMLYSLFNVHDASGEMVGWATVSRNITERRQKESLLRASEDRYRSLFDNMMEGFSYCRMLYEQGSARDFVYLEVNAAFEKLTGLTDVTGKKVSEVIPGIRDSDSALFELYDRVALTGKPERTEIYVQALSAWFSISIYSPAIEHFVAIFDVITERKQAEAALVASEKDFHWLAEAMPQIVWITRADGRNIYFNQQWTEYTGLTLEESYGHGWNKPFHPEDQQRAWDTWQNAVITHSTYSLECRLRRLDGNYRWWLVRGVPVFDEEGQIFKWFGTCTDINEIKLAEQSLRSADNLTRSIMDSLDSAIVVLDERGNIIRINHAWQCFAEQNGGNEQIMAGIGLNYFDVCRSATDTPDANKTLEGMLAVLSGQQKQFKIEYPCDSPDIKRWFRLEVVPLKGTLSGLVAHHIDITERKNTEEILRQKSRLLTESQRIASIGSWMIDLKDWHVNWSEQTFVLYGLTPGVDKAPAMDQFLLLLHPDDRPAMQAWNIACLAGENQLGLEFRTRPINGEFRWLLGSGVLENDIHDQPFRMIGTVQDITTQKKHEAELCGYRDHLENLVKERTEELNVAREQAEHFSQVKSDFLANMSHEIRTPMNAVLGFCYLLEQRPLDDDTLSLVRKIHGAGRSLLSIINDILDFSKIEAGRLEIERVPFNLSNVLDHLAALMSTSAGHKNLELIIIPPTNVDALIGDELRLQQVLVNLLSNAIKFTERGEVELRVSIISEQDDQVNIRFAVRDTGMGISFELQQAIFSAFTQADSTISRRFGGSGLGLAICMKLVRLMGGELQVNSCQGEGSEFWFVLPLQLNAQADRPPLPLANLHLLVADDSSTARDALLLTAHSLGWRADVVDSGKSALSQTLASFENKTPYDVLLLDWKMPGMDGLATAQALREAILMENGEASQAPIVLMVTAYSREELLAQSGMTSIDGVLNKPVTASVLYNAVAKVLFQRQHNGLVPIAPVEASTQRIPGVRVLVVDDSEINREVVMCILEADGAEVSLASDGQEALDWLSMHDDAVDIVLMDIQMPRMDGYAATRQIRKNPNWAHLPVIALTAGAFKSSQDDALAAGLNDFISKPFNVPQLMALIQRWTGCKPPKQASDDQPDGALFSNPDIKSLTQSTVSHPELLGIDIETGLKTWSNVEFYQHYLSGFITNYRNAGRDIAAAAQHGDYDSIAALTHKIKGAAYNLALANVATQSIEVETALGNMESLPMTAMALQAAIDEVAGSLEKWLNLKKPAAENHKTIELLPEKMPEIKPLLTQLLLALDEQNILRVESLLTTIESLIGSESIALIKTQIQDFNLREAQALTKALIHKFKSSQS